jgi:hypothetical protein
MRREKSVSGKTAPPAPLYRPVKSPQALRMHEYESLLASPIVDVQRLRDICWSGIPDPFRARVWRLLLDYEPVNQSIRQTVLCRRRSDYLDCASRVYGDPRLLTPFHQEILEQIEHDLPRSRINSLMNSKVRVICERVLFVWAVRHPASGYVQGMDDLLAPFISVFLGEHCPDDDPGKLTEGEVQSIEADCFWCFSSLMESLQDLFIKGQPGVTRMLTDLRRVVAANLGTLAEWIEREAITYQEFAWRWANCLLVRELPLAAVLRIWDSYFGSHRTIAASHVFVCAAVMALLGNRVIGLPHGEFVSAVQRTLSDVWEKADVDVILAQAFVYQKLSADKRSL